MQVSKTPFIIAEVGINHNGDIAIARRLIEMAKNSGCDAVKFQKRTPEICVPANQRSLVRETPWGLMTYLEYRQHIEFGKDEFDIIDAYCKEKEIEWFASAWDLDSQEFLRQYNLRYNKVASAMLTNIPLLEKIAEEKKYTFIATGMSTYEDIDKAVDIFQKYQCEYALMHCVSGYPVSDDDCNLLVINELQKRYNCPVGYSGHEVSVLPSVIAAVLGAVAIERHITLDRAMWGTDQAASLEKRGLELVVRDSKLVSSILGDGIKRVTEQETGAAKKLRYFREDDNC